MLRIPGPSFTNSPNPAHVPLLRPNNAPALTFTVPLLTLIETGDINASLLKPKVPVPETTFRFEFRVNPALSVTVTVVPAANPIATAALLSGVAGPMRMDCPDCAFQPVVKIEVPELSNIWEKGDLLRAPNV
jgi:hypothetical protein